MTLIKEETKINQPDELFERINKYYLNINITIEVNTSNFLDTKNYCDNNKTMCFEHHKKMKLLFRWTSAVPKRYQKNVIMGDLHRASNLSSNFRQEVWIIRGKYIKTGFSFCFINSITDTFNQEKEDLFRPICLFEERKEVSFQIIFWKPNEHEIFDIIDKLEGLTNYKVKCRYFWKTR